MPFRETIIGNVVYLCVWHAICVGLLALYTALVPIDSFFTLEVCYMRKRMKMSRGKSKRSFRGNAGVHPRNRSNPMRGGIRL